MQRFPSCRTLRLLAPYIGLVACSRYEWRPADLPAPPPTRVAARLDTVPAPPGVLAAQLLAPPGGGGVDRAWRARLRSLATGAAWADVRVDTVTGRLRVAGLPAGAYELDTYAIGLGPRRDTLSLTPERGTAMVLVVSSSPTVIPAAIRARKPWWKLW